MTGHAHEWTGYFRLDLLLVIWRCWCGHQKYAQIGQPVIPAKNQATRASTSSDHSSSEPNSN